MPPAAPHDPEVRIIPLAEADSAAIDALFDEQQVEWMDRLRWDYTAPSKILREVIARRELLGFAAVAGSATIGFSFYIVESARCSIGDIYVSRPWRQAGADGKMASAIVDSLKRFPRMRRIECQSPVFDNPAADGVFLALGFQRFDRHFMVTGLSASDQFCLSSDGSSGREASTDFTVRPWNEDDFDLAARTIYKSYEGSLDGEINVLYSSEEGCAELLSILMDSIWCGRFLPEVSLVAVDGKTGKQLGLLIASAIAPDVGHIGQVSVIPSYQGLGIARRMIHLALTQLARRGYAAASLAVTHQNTRARRIYESAGFRILHSFPVYYRQLQ
jgi:ribosomal protein S18 acetylase RimI-like enzyme